MAKTFNSRVGNDGNQGKKSGVSEENLRDTCTQIG
jgi:hypothetical protein